MWVHIGINNSFSFQLYQLENIQNSLDEDSEQEVNAENYPYYDYDLLVNGDLNDLNAEEKMLTKEEKGPLMQSPESGDQDLEYFGEYLKGGDLGSFLREQLQQGKEFDSSIFEEQNDEAEHHHDEAMGRVVKPIIHYKESFISGDSYNKKLLDQNALSTVVY